MYKQRFYTILGILKSPNLTLREICDNEGSYLISSVIILVLASVFTVSMANGPLDENIASVSQFGIWMSDDPIDWITDAIFGFLASVVLIVIIFLIGKKFGGIGNFKKIFAVISHATLPVVIGGIISFAAFFALSSTIPDTVDETDSQFQYFGLAFYFGVIVPFSIWSLIISIKAIKIANGFGTGKALGIILLASIISYVIWIPANWLSI